MTDEPVRRYLVRCDGAQVPVSWRAEPWVDTLDVFVNPVSDAAVNLAIRGLAGTVLEASSPRTEDLLRILAGAFRADEMVARARDTDVHGDNWTRAFAVCIGVRDPDFWADTEVQRLLASFLGYGSDDAWRFHFSALPRRHPTAVQLTLELDVPPVVNPPGSVVLLSGGLDSLAILAEAAARGERPIAVSHWAGTGTRSRQVALLTGIASGPRARDRFGGWSFPAIGAEVHRLGREARERNRRTRGALFAGLGGAVAGELGLDRVYLGDNGPISLNLPINDQLVGARASRSTHPLLLARASALLSAVYGRPIRVANPLWSRTRAEAIDLLVALDATDLIPKTLSCSNWGWGQRTAAVPQCGACSQCVDRRFAAVAAGVEDCDPAEGYAHDVFLTPPPDPRAALLALGYVRFAQRVVDMTDLDLLAEYPQLTEAVLADDPDPDGTMQALLDLTHRHARAVLDALDRKLRAAGPLFARGKVAATSLLLLSAADPRLTAPSAPVLAAESAAAIAVVPIRTEREVAPSLLVRKGDFWEVSFGERTISLKHGDGVARLAFLLEHPDQEYTPTELLRATGAFRVDTAMRGETDDEMHVAGTASANRIYDAEALGAFKTAIARLEHEAAAARAAGNEELAAAKDAECRQISAFRNEGTRPGNLAQTFRDAGSKDYDAVYQSLRRLLITLNHRHPPLADHLRRVVTYGVRNAYRPDDRVRWLVEIPSEAA